MAPVRFATHPDPAWRDRTDFIIQVDLAPYRMAGRFEQLWAHKAEGGVFELCCIPFFTYGFALGDQVHWDEETSALTLAARSGRRNYRVAFAEPATSAGHTALHAGLVGTGCLFEFASSGLAAIDIAADDQLDRVHAVTAPMVDAGLLLWEWGDDPT